MKKTKILVLVTVITMLSIAFSSYGAERKRIAIIGFDGDVPQKTINNIKHLFALKMFHRNK